MSNLYEAAIDDKLDAFNSYACLRKWKNQDEMLVMNEN